MSQSDIIDHYASTGYEDKRLVTGIGRLEVVRTREIIQRYLAPTPQVIIDAGGGTGPYAFWLAELGHTVHLLDLVPRHAEMARERARTAIAAPASITVGDARALPYPDGSADVVLLMGPLYHLVERAHRLEALREGARVLKKGGRLLCAAISRYASMLDGFRSRLFDDPGFEAIVDRDLHDGQHRNPSMDKDYFTTAYFHHPQGLRGEVATAGLACDHVIGVEGPWCAMNEMQTWLDRQGRYYELTLKYAQVVEEEESLLGANFHLLAVATQP
jgi:ubiquinone/menaquinone biosynthesis C-methylase UbiE